jgi:hypothetical protein
MTTKDEALKKALEALRLYQRTLAPSDTQCRGVAAVAAIEQALASPVQEPVAAECKFDREQKWVRCEIAHHNLVQSAPHHWPGYQTRLLYTTPPIQPAPVNRDGQEQPFEEWWEREGQFGRAGGGQYEKTFAWNAWCAALDTPPAQPALMQQPATLDEMHAIGNGIMYGEQPAVQEGRDWSLLEATQESLREHMAEIKRLKAAQPAPVQSVDFETWFASEDRLKDAPKDDYPITHLGMVELAKDSMRYAWNAAHGITAAPKEGNTP